MATSTSSGAGQPGSAVSLTGCASVSLSSRWGQQEHLLHIIALCELPIVAIVTLTAENFGEEEEVVINSVLG